MGSGVSRSVTSCWALGVALVGAMLLRLAIGPGTFALPARMDFFELRLDRVIAGVSVGASLGVAGALLQAILRNALASPFLLGLTSGAGLGVVVATYATFLTTGSVVMGGTPVVAVLVGSFGAMGLVFLLSWRRGTPDPSTLVLVGVIVSILCAAATTFVQHLMPDTGMAVYTRWVMGSISDDTGRATLYGVAFLTIAGSLWAITLGSDLDGAALSDDEARSVGVALGRLRSISLLIAGVLTAGSVLLAGPIGFVGLIGPHIARRLAGPSHRTVVLASALAGGTLVVLADAGVMLIQTPSGRVPVGAVTALLGGPLFIWLMRRGRAL